MVQECSRELAKQFTYRNLVFNSRFSVAYYKSFVSLLKFTVVEVLFKAIQILILKYIYAVSIKNAVGFKEHFPWVTLNKTNNLCSLPKFLVSLFNITVTSAFI